MHYSTRGCTCACASAVFVLVCVWAVPMTEKGSCSAQTATANGQTWNPMLALDFSEPHITPVISSHSEPIVAQGKSFEPLFGVMKASVTMSYSYSCNRPPIVSAKW